MDDCLGDRFGGITCLPNDAHFGCGGPFSTSKNCRCTSRRGHV